MYKGDEGESYISKFPSLKKWINECCLCHAKGYNPNMPERISPVEGAMDVYFIKKYFKPLAVNEDSICDTCIKLIKTK